MKRVQRNGVIDPWKLIGVAYFNVCTDHGAVGNGM